MIDNGQLNILLLIRNQELRQLYHEILVNEGWEVVISDEAAKALLALISNKIELIIIDAKLSQYETQRFLQIVMRKPEWKSLPIILLDYPDRHKSLSQETVKSLNIVAELNTHLINPSQLIQAVTGAVKR